MDSANHNVNGKITESTNSKIWKLCKPEAEPLELPLELDDDEGAALLPLLFDDDDPEWSSSNSANRSRNFGSSTAPMTSGSHGIRTSGGFSVWTDEKRQGSQSSNHRAHDIAICSDTVRSQ